MSSSEEKLKIIRHFLLNAPPGEFEDVLDDLQELVDDEELLKKNALDIFYTYNIEQLIPVDVPESDYQVVLSKYGEIDQDHFVDPHTNNILTVDHTKGKVVKVESRDEAESSVAKGRRSALQKAIDSYVKNVYTHGLSTVFTQSDDEFVVCITASKVNEKNFWSGRWRSIYKISYTGDDSVKVVGTMKVNVHYYEKGNVQLNTSREHDVSLSGDIPSKVAASLEKGEGAFQTQIDTQCTNMNETFKSLRRKLPITGNKFSFETGSQKMLLGSS